MRRIRNCGDGVTLTLLANYVDPEFWMGSYITRGELSFFLLGLGLLLPIYWLLKRSEGKEENAKQTTIPASFLTS